MKKQKMVKGAIDRFVKIPGQQTLKHMFIVVIFLSDGKEKSGTIKFRE